MGDQEVLKRVIDVGVRGASPIDLVAVGFSRRESDVELGESMAREMLEHFGSLKELGDAGNGEITESTGLIGFEVIRAVALIEIGRRCGTTERRLKKDTVECAEDAFHLLKHLRGEKREHFVAILLDAKGKVMRVAEIHIGTLTASIVGPREIFREAIRDGASSIIVAHNHPSGDPTPSPEDIDVTKKLVDIGEMLDIPVLDHIIIGEKEARSLRGGETIGRKVGRNHLRVARESTSYARSEGVGAWALS